MKTFKEDVAGQTPFVSGAIDKVGLEDLEIPLQLRHKGKLLPALANVSAMVSLDKARQRGIHMSRLYLSLHEFFKKTPLTLLNLKSLLKLLADSQGASSRSAFVKIKWLWPVERKALKSKNLKGWRAYPVFYEGSLLKGGKMILRTGVEVVYSSTCPCSASLSRELIQKKFQTDFKNFKGDKKEIFKWFEKENSLSAVPHAQKSRAFLKMTITPRQVKTFCALNIIDEAEKVLGTPVQTAVKKADEQEFARLNSRNLMFSEDAARRIAKLLNRKKEIEDFEVCVKHFESLHPFEVACVVTKKGFS